MTRRLCYWCRQPMTRRGTGLPRSATKEHLTPKSRGGTNHPDNIVMACKRCNNDKGLMTEPEYRAELERRSAEKKKYRFMQQPSPDPSAERA